MKQEKRPHPHKGKKWDEWMPKRAQKKIRKALARIAERRRGKPNPHGGQNKRKVIAVLTTPKQKIVSPQYLMNPYSFKSDGGSIDKPCFTLIARMDKMPPYLISTDEGIGIKIFDDDTPMTCKIKEFMAAYGIIDIKMRMLKIAELKRIMGFPENYTLIGTQAEQKKFIGNAVEVNMSRVLCEALSKRLKK